MVKNPPAMKETLARGGNDNLSNILAGKIPWWATVHGELDVAE